MAYDRLIHPLCRLSENSLSPFDKAMRKHLQAHTLLFPC